MTTFVDTGLKPALLTALEELGFEKPTPIQEQTIPHLLASKKDLIALAQTGTGKTAAFGLPLLHQINVSERRVQALILCPTRELCLQIAKDLERFGKYLSGLSIAAIYGGDSIGRQLGLLERGVHIVVGTPGRVNDFLERRKLKLETIQTLVLDEADEMLNMGFKEELDTILAQTPEGKQTLLFSATMPDSIRRIAQKYMKKPDQIQAAGALSGSKNVSHRYYTVQARDRYQALRRIVDANPQIYGIVFCRTRRETQDVANHLSQEHYSAEALHGDMSQGQREQVMNRFKRQQTQLLIATDVAARGIDVNELTHVIHYQLPDTSEAYLHRSGRTGRANNTGLSIAIIHLKERHIIRRLEQKVGQRFEECLLPTAREISEKRLFAIIDKVKKTVVNEEQIGPFIPAILHKLEELDRETLIKHFVSVEFNQFLESNKDARDLSVPSKELGREPRERHDRQDRSDRARRQENYSFKQFFLPFGRRDGFTKKHLFELINSEKSLKGVQLGHIEVEGHRTVFELDVAYADLIQTAFRGIQSRDGRAVQARPL